MSLGQVAEHVEVLEPIDLARKLCAPVRFVAAVSLRPDCVEDALA
ncbi:MAG: hypothetical protein ACRDLL_14770 [Solirubrobacterales bacterium]